MNRKERKEAERLKPLGAEGLARVRQVLAEHQYAKVNEVMVDIFTANAIVRVYDSCNEQNQQKLISLPVAKVAKVCFSCLA